MRAARHRPEEQHEERERNEAGLTYEDQVLVVRPEQNADVVVVPVLEVMQPPEAVSEERRLQRHVPRHLPQRQPASQRDVVDSPVVDDLQQGSPSRELQVIEHARIQPGEGSRQHDAGEQQNAEKTPLLDTPARQQSMRHKCRQDDERGPR